MMHTVYIYIYISQIRFLLSSARFFLGVLLPVEDADASSDFASLFDTLDCGAGFETASLDEQAATSGSRLNRFPPCSQTANRSSSLALVS